MRIPVNSEERYKRQGDIPYYGANGQVGWIDDCIFDEELVLIAEDGGFFDEYDTRPIAYMISGKSWVNNHAHVLRAIQGITTNSWVFYNLVHSDIRYYIKGGTRSKLNQGELREIEIPLPPLAEQRRIAEIMDAADEAIRQTERLIGKLKAVKAGLLHDLLTCGLDEHGHLRDPQAHPEQFKDSPLGRIPKEWEVSRVNEICILGRGRVISQVDLDQNPGPYPVYSSQSKDEGVFGYLNTFDFDGEYVTWTTDGAYAGTVFYRCGRFNCTNVCGTLEAKSQGLSMKYLASALSTRTGKHVSYVGNPKLMNSVMAEIPVLLPSYSEQKAIAAVLDAHDTRIRAEEAALAKLRQVKRGLMDALLTGKVRVQV